MEPIIQTDNLTIGYHSKNRQHIVRENLFLQVHAKDLIALIGSNGCGKSTLLRTMAGLQVPISGDVFIRNENIRKKNIHEKAKIISLVLTDPVKANGLTVGNLIAMGRFPHTNWLGKLQQEDKSKIEEAIELIGLNGYENRFLTELSDGEKQRVMIAKALVQDTPVIFLDEPTAHLDVNNRVEILSLLKKICEQTSKAILFSTHELDLALKLANRIWLMDNKKGVYDKSPDEIISENTLNDIFPNLFHFNENGTLEYLI